MGNYEDFMPDSSSGGFMKLLRFNVLVLIALFSCFAGIASGRHVMPKGKNGGPLIVEIAVFVIDVDDIDGANQNFTANVFYMCSWHDPNIAERFDEVDVLPVMKLWTPKIQVVNQQKIWPTMPETVEVYPDGKVIYRQRVWGQFSMPFNLKDFPFDEQDFSVQFVTIGRNRGDLRFKQSEELPSGLAKEFSQADWKILDWEAKSQRYSPIKGIDNEGFILKFWAKRKTGYYIMKIIIPLILIVMMSWAVFWIDPTDSGTQVGVAVTSMLTLIAYRFATDALLPKVSYFTRLDYFILGSTILIFTGLIEVLVTTKLAKMEKVELARIVDKVARVAMPLLFAAFTLKAFVF